MIRLFVFTHDIDIVNKVKKIAYKTIQRYLTVRLEHKILSALPNQTPHNPSLSSGLFDDFITDSILTLWIRAGLP